MSGAGETARAAARHWGRPQRLRLLAERENAVFALTLEGGRRLALRLHRPGYNSTAEIESELWWTGALAERGFPVPAPVPGADGRLLLPLAGGRVATALQWLDGQPIGTGGSPLPGSAAEQGETCRALGRLLARLHEDCDALTLPPGFVRRRWDAEGFLGESPLWGRFWESPALTPRQAGLLGAARAAARQALAAHDATDPDRGLIHADALRENVFRTRAGLALIDFDDAGFGYRLYDLAVALSQGLSESGDAARMAALLEGYDEIRPLGAADRAALPLFRLLRALASLGWATARLHPGAPAMAPYRQRALAAAEDFLC